MRVTGVLKEVETVCQCEDFLNQSGFNTGFRQNGDEWKCPNCGEIFIYIDDEAEGGFFTPKLQ